MVYCNFIIFFILLFIFFNEILLKMKNGDWGLGIGDWGLGIGLNP